MVWGFNKSVHLLYLQAHIFTGLSKVHFFPPLSKCSIIYSPSLHSSAFQSSAPEHRATLFLMLPVQLAELPHRTLNPEPVIMILSVEIRCCGQNTKQQPSREYLSSSFFYRLTKTDPSSICSRSRRPHPTSTRTQHFRGQRWRRSPKCNPNHQHCGVTL